MSPAIAPTSLPLRAIVIGTSGGIGAALQRGLLARGVSVSGLSRSQKEALTGGELPIDITCEDSIEAAAACLRYKAPFFAILVATGLLHDADVSPEKALRDLDQASLMRLFSTNAVGPALVAKHFVPLLAKQGRCVFAVLSARVGSIGDNRLGGWYGYRASKAALNMLIKTLAIELARPRPEAICVGLHPGTVDTDLSKPFQRAVSRNGLFSPDQSAAHLLNVIDQLTPAQSGRCFAWNGAEISP
jgi:NAD(P)-dependent dehydrogenase (short-subunit alcohol dehydrogenase family)